MRYTLRLLTAQQFQRAAALVCACEVLRRERSPPATRGGATTPFRIGLWVGAAVDARTRPSDGRGDRDQRARRLAQGAARRLAAAARRLPVVRHGDRARPGRRGRRRATGGATLLVLRRPGRATARSRRGTRRGEGLPVVTVDEEIYRLLPALVIATVDKFAQLPWNGATADAVRPGDAAAARATASAPRPRRSAGQRTSTRTADSCPRRATSRRCRLRPPDLIIQDELHLISGAARHAWSACTRRRSTSCAPGTLDGSDGPAEGVASTATIRRAGDQVHAAVPARPGRSSRRRCSTRGDNFFARQRAADADDTPGRRYLGICAPGRAAQGRS